MADIWSYLFGSDFYIYIYIYSPFHFRFVSRHNTNHRANGEATAHSNQASGAFWSRVTPPELLYIWLLSFDEFRLAMNTHLPVVRPLFCYARRGATPMHQKKHRSVRDHGPNTRGHANVWESIMQASAVACQ